MYRGKNSSTKTKIRKDLFVWVFVLAVMAAIAVGDVEQGPKEIVAEERTESVGAMIAASEVEVPMDSAIQSIKFNKDQLIRDALRVLAAKYRKNIVPSPKVDGVLAFTTLIDVTFEEAMDAILGMNLRYEQKGNLIKVYTRDEYKKVMEDKDRMISRLFKLFYISAAEAMRLIDPVLSGAGSIMGSTPAETVVPTGATISAGASGGDSMALNDTIVILDYPENMAAAEEMLEELDVRPKQVLIEATILTARLTEGMELGVDLSFMAGVALDGTAALDDYAYSTGVSRGSEASHPIADIKGITAGTPLETSGFATVGGSGLRIGISTGDVRMFISALESVTDTTILANPKILAVNKQLGQVFIGTKVGYVSQTTQIDTSTTQKVEYLETGTKLSFRPYIGDNGYIRMDIQPKDSSHTLKANDIPDETVTELATNIIVKDGQTIVIGGLFRDVVVTSRDQVPLLGDIPLIGALFRGTSDATQREEVIVMLTVHIINEPDETNADARAADIDRKRYGARMTLQGISRARLAEDHYANAVGYYADGNSVEALAELDGALELRPTYLEAIRLKERIIGEISPDEVRRIERIMLGVIEREEASKWLRR